MLETDFIAAKDKESKRLLVVLHGLGDSLEGYRWLPQILDLPWMNYLLVNAPDPYYGGFSWYGFEGDPGPDIQRSRALVTELLDARRAAGFPSEQTILFGFSQGCLMTLDTGLRYPHRLAGLVGISGYAHEPEKILRELSPAGRTVPVLMTHGTQDTLIPLVPVRAQASLLRDKGVNLRWKEFAKAHTIAGEEEIQLIRDFINQCYA